MNEYMKNAQDSLYKLYLDRKNGKEHDEYEGCLA